MCTPTCLDFVRRALSSQEVAGKSILEAGSYNWNGSSRKDIEALSPVQYIGVDMTAGPGLDVVCDSGSLIAHFGPNSIDVLVTTEMFEHVTDWRLVLKNLKGIVKPGGLLVLTTRSQGFPYHACPYDFWRYSLEDMRELFADFEILLLESDPEQPGVFIKARKPLHFKEKNLDAYELYSMIKHRRYRAVTWFDMAWLQFNHQVKDLWTVRIPKALKPFFPGWLRESLKQKVMHPILHLFHADRKSY